MTKIQLKSSIPLPFRSFAPVVALVCAAGCSGGELVLPQSDNDIKLSVVSGDQQTGAVGEQLPKPILVELRDQDGHAIVGREIVFAATDGPAAATLTPPTAVTDGDGQAIGQWVLGTKPGSYTAEARLKRSADDSADTELPVVQVTASAQAGPPDTLRAESETQQVDQNAGEQVEEAPVVRVVDRYGNPVPGVTVRWNANAGATISDDEVQTDADGRATVTWTLGRQRFTLYRLTASVEGSVNGSPVNFSAVVF